MTPTPHSAPGHRSGSKDEDIIGTSQKIWGYLGSVGLIVLAMFFINGIRSCMSEKEAEAVAARAARAAAEERARLEATQVVRYTKVLIPRFDRLTPCDPEIPFAFELDTQGDPIFLKFPGIKKLVEYSGKGTLKAPEGRRSGPVEITSQKPDKEARVRIWEVTTMKERKWP
ncbi:hypothetical protein HYZ82_02260 [Candidatus Nomurabacteria bacterium]|nr:hypothetical protein [Candidatus Nomurabacteria bacterium]